MNGSFTPQFLYSPVTKIGNIASYKAVDVVGVYKAAKRVVESLSIDAENEGDDADAVGEGVEVNALDIEAAKSTLIFKLIAKTPTAASEATNRIDECFEGRSFNSTREAIAKTLSVTAADVQRVIRERVKPIFDPKGSAKIIVTANPANVEQIAGDFRQMGLEVEIVDLEQMINGNA